MKAVQKVLLGLGLSLFVSSGLYASEDYMGDHMHEGKMTNHMNMDEYAGISNCTGGIY